MVGPLQQEIAGVGEISVAELAEYLRDPDTAEYQIRRLAYYVHTLAEDEQTYPVPAPEVCDPDRFNRIFDPNLPTILVDPLESFTGVVSVSLADAVSGERKCNVIFGSVAGDGVHFAENNGRGECLVTKGVLFDTDFSPVYGDFPQPVSIDAVQSADVSFLEQCKKWGVVTLEDPDVIGGASDKHGLEDILSIPDVLPPKRYSLGSGALTQQAEIIIKPANLSQGTGVKFFSPQHEKEDIVAYHSFLGRAGYEPVIEERIRSCEFVDPDTGERLDWNVRAIIAQGTYIGMYVRADSWGEPVNTSRGARTLSLEEARNYFKDGKTADQVYESLRSASMGVAERFAEGHLGIDLTVDESGAVRIFELNFARIGGLQTIARLLKNSAHRTNLFLSVRDAWLDRLSTEKQPLAQEEIVPGTIEIPEISLAVRSLTARYMGDFGLLAHISPTELLDYASRSLGDRQAAYDCLVHRMHHSVRMLDIESLSLTENILATRFPLDIVRILPFLMSESTGFGGFRGLVEFGDRFFPDDKIFIVSKTMLMAQDFDLPVLGKNYARALDAWQDHQRVDRFIHPWIVSVLAATTRKYDETGRYQLGEAVFRSALFAAINGYDAFEASDVFESGITSVPSGELGIVKDQLRAIIAIGCREYSIAKKIISELPDESSSVVHDFISEREISSPMNTVEAAKFLLEYHILYGSVSSALGCLIRSVRSKKFDTSEARGLVFDVITQIETQIHEDQLLGVAQNIVSAVYDTDVEPPVAFLDNLEDLTDAEVLQIFTRVSMGGITYADVIDRVEAYIDERFCVKSV